MNLTRSLSALALAGTVLVTAHAAEPQRPQDVMDSAIDRMASEVKNARTKLKHGVRGFARGAAAPSAAASTGDTSRGGRIGRDSRPEASPLAAKPSSCCGPNVSALAEQLRVVRAVVEEYGRRLGDDEQARGRIARMASQWKSLDSALTGFRSTDSREVADAALGAFQASLIELDGTHDELVECCVRKARKNQQ